MSCNIIIIIIIIILDVNFDIKIFWFRRRAAQYNFHVFRNISFFIFPNIKELSRMKKFSVQTFSVTK